MSPTQDRDPIPGTAKDADAAQSAAERLMAAYRVQQEIESGHASRDRTASRWIIVGCSVLLGAGAGALMGASRGHALVGALLMALVGGLLGMIGQRAL